MSEVIFSSSYDDRNPPTNIFTSNKNEFFSSTGMFPQEITIQFNTVKNLSKINLVSYGIKKIKIETCENDTVVKFKTQAEQKDVPNSNRRSKIFNKEKSKIILIMIKLFIIILKTNKY